MSWPFGLQDEHLAVGQPDQEVGPVLPHHAAIDVEDLKPQVVVLDPGLDVVGCRPARRPRCLPGAVVDADVDVRPWAASHGLAGVPGRMSPVQRMGCSLSNTGASFSVFSNRIASQMCWTILRHVERQQDAPAQVVLVEQRRGDGDAVRTEELLDQARSAGPAGLRGCPSRSGFIWSNTSRAVSKTIFCSAELPRQSLQVDPCDPRHVRLAVEHRGQLGEGRGLGGVQLQRHAPCQVERQYRLVDVVDAQHVGPGDLELRLSPGRARPASSASAAAAARPRPPSCGRKVNGTPKMLTYSGSNKPGLRVHFVGGAPQAPPDHLLAQQLAGEGPQAHDVRDRLGVPALGEHAHGDDVLDLSRRAGPACPRCPPSRADARPARSWSASAPVRRLLLRPRLVVRRFRGIERLRPATRPCPAPSSRCAGCAPGRTARRCGSCRGQRRTSPGPPSPCGWPTVIITGGVGWPGCRPSARPVSSQSLPSR